MKKLLLAFTMLGLATAASAADPLHGTVWKTIDDSTKQAKAQVVFNQQADGTLSANIQRIFSGDAGGICSSCEGKYHNKSLQGVTIVSGLKPIGNNQYEGGEILDPKNGKTYRLKGELTQQNKVLKLRGYLGVALLGRDQVWQRIQ